MEANLRADTIGALPEDLAAERDLVRLVDLVKRDGDAASLEELARLVATDAVLLGLLRSSLSETRSQTVGDVTVQTESVLPWEWLETLVAPEDFGARVTALDASTIEPADSRLIQAVATARRYAGGWRPDSAARMTHATSSEGRAAADVEGEAQIEGGSEDSDAAGQNPGRPDKS